WSVGCIKEIEKCNRLAMRSHVAEIGHRFAQCFIEVSSQLSHSDISINGKPERFCSKEAITRVLPFQIAINQSSESRFTNTSHACEHNSCSVKPDQSSIYILDGFLTLHNSPG